MSNDSNNVISFVKKAATDNKDYSSLEELIDLVKNIPEDTQLTDLAASMSGDVASASSRYDVRTVATTLTRKEIGILNFLAMLSKTIGENITELNNSIPEAVMASIIATVNINNPYEVEVGLDLLSNICPPELTPKVESIRKLILMYRFIEVSYAVSVSSRVRFLKFTTQGFAVHTAKLPFSLVSVNSI